MGGSDQSRYSAVTKLDVETSSGRGGGRLSLEQRAEALDRVVVDEVAGAVDTGDRAASASG